ncbi:MAG: polyprenyl synthetase family protein [Myxococcota bacterium]
MSLTEPIAQASGEAAVESSALDSRRPARRDRQPEVLRLLRQLAHEHSADGSGVGRRLGELQALLATDLQSLERLLDDLPRPDRAVSHAAHHLLDLRGKRLRPMCVMLAARLGTGSNQRTLDVAVAVELVHAATLLHDDVVDLGDRRRGAPAARMLFGNATSVYAGDWLLIEALRRVRRTHLDDPFDRLLEVIDQMILAESIQLEARGALRFGTDRWLQIVEGKTGALFRWAMFAGGASGELTVDRCAELEGFGHHLGVAFQATDDVLDLDGDPGATGKELFADLREGKMTYPVLLAAERDPSLVPMIQDLAGSPEPELAAKVKARIDGTGAIADTRSFARKRAEQAVLALEPFPPGPARDALVTAAFAAVNRSR